MARVVELPPELWLIIFDLFIDANIDPVDHCTYLTFTEISHHLRQPCEFPSVIYSFLQNLRLVCRAFKHLLKSSPYFLMSDLSGVAPRNIRALCIKPNQNVDMYLERALSEPSKCRRIVLLNLLGAEPHSIPCPISFDCLYDNARHLPDLRGLALSVRVPPSRGPVIPRFWGRLNESFPLLTSLVLRGRLDATYPSPAVTFEKLKILDWAHFEPYRTMGFPALRYVALGGISPLGMARFTSWSHLESLLLRSLHFGLQVPWHLLPNLRMLGIPQVDGYAPLAVTRLPEGHPIRHLHVYVHSRLRDSHNRTVSTYENELAWLNETIKQLPVLTEIVLWHTNQSEIETPLIQGDFKDEDLRLLSFVDNDSSAQRSDRRCVTLRRRFWN